MPKRLKAQVKAVDVSAAYFEKLFRSRFVKTMKQVQKKVSINKLAISMHLTHTSRDTIPRQLIEEALQQLKPIIVQAYMKGGRLGAQHVVSVLNVK